MLHIYAYQNIDSTTGRQEPPVPYIVDENSPQGQMFLIGLDTLGIIYVTTAQELTGATIIDSTSDIQELIQYSEIFNAGYTECGGEMEITVETGTVTPPTPAPSPIPIDPEVSDGLVIGWETIGG